MIADAITLWWETMAGPQILIRRIADDLSEGKSVLLRSSGRLPWQEQMRDILSHQLGKNQPTKEKISSSKLLLGIKRKKEEEILTLFFCYA